MAIFTLKDRFARVLAPFVAGTIDEAAFDQPLRDLGVDSVRLIELIGALEEGLGVSFGDEDITPRNFRTPRSILELVVLRTSPDA